MQAKVTLGASFSPKTFTPIGKSSERKEAIDDDTVSDEILEEDGNTEDGEDYQKTNFIRRAWFPRKHRRSSRNKAKAEKINETVVQDEIIGQGDYENSETTAERVIWREIITEKP